MCQAIQVPKAIFLLAAAMLLGVCGCAATGTLNSTDAPAPVSEQNEARHDEPINEELRERAEQLLTESRVIPANIASYGSMSASDATTATPLYYRLEGTIVNGETLEYEGGFHADHDYVNLPPGTYEASVLASPILSDGTMFVDVFGTKHLVVGAGTYASYPDELEKVARALGEGQYLTVERYDQDNTAPGALAANSSSYALAEIRAADHGLISEADIDNAVSYAKNDATCVLSHEEIDALARKARERYLVPLVELVRDSPYFAADMPKDHVDIDEFCCHWKGMVPLLEDGPYDGNVDVAYVKAYRAKASDYVSVDSDLYQKVSDRPVPRSDYVACVYDVEEIARYGNVSEMKVETHFAYGNHWDNASVEINTLRVFVGPDGKIVQVE